MPAVQTRATDTPVDLRAIRAARGELLPSERVVAAQRRHIACLTGPTAALLTGFVLVMWIMVVTPASLGVFSDWSLRLWLLMLLYYIYVVLSWQHDWFIATDRRLILVGGLLGRRTAMMPLAKVTDLTFERPLLGRIVGYGTFILESAGQDQALHRLSFVRQPNSTYIALCEELFGRRKSPAAASGGGSGTERPDVLARVSGGPVDDTDVPLARLGSYLDRSAQVEAERRARPKGRIGLRLLRGPQPMETFGDDANLLMEQDDQSRSWEVSTEDASAPQQVIWREERD